MPAQPKCRDVHGARFPCLSALIVGDEVVHYEVLGRGRPLIFVHGWLGSWRYWIPTMQSLSGDYRAYALDLWGFGDSSKIASRYTLDAQADLLGGFMEQLGILKGAFVGHGLGGAVAARFALKIQPPSTASWRVSVPVRGASVSSRMHGGPAASLLEGLLGKDPALEPISREAAKGRPARDRDQPARHRRTRSARGAARSRRAVPAWSTAKRT